MQLNFQLEEADYRDFSAHSYRRLELAAQTRSKLSTLIWSYHFLLVLAVIAFLFFLSENGGPGLNHLYAAVLFLILRVVCGYLLSWRNNKLQLHAIMSASGMHVRPQKLTIDENGVIIDHGVCHVHYQWEAIQMVYQTKRQFILYTDTTQGICVPLRAFESPREVDAFDLFAKTCIAAC